jgi:MFS family permease
MSVVFTFSFNFSVLVPLLAKQTFGGDAATFGLMSALAGFGSFMAALVMANRAGTRTASPPGIRRLAIFALTAGTALALTAFAPTLRLAYVSMVPLGLTVMLFIITANSMLQLASKPAFRGRVMALYGMVFLGSTPIGALIAGGVGEHLGPRVAFLMGAVAALAVGAVALWWRSRVPAGVELAPDLRPDIGFEAI